jgi:outer membrane lipoprotein-sorting protein
MRPILFFISALLLLTRSLSGQDDKEAIRILDNFSANALRAPSVTMKFQLVTANQMENTKDSITGSIILSKDKYRLEMTGNTVWFNGETSWNYLSAENEVTITKADRKNNSFQNRPSLIFSMYKDGYKCRFVEERSESYLIDLYPKDIKNDLLRVRLSIGKPMMNLKSLEYKKRDGIVITLNVIEYDLKIKAEPDFFIFQPGKYKGAEVIDMR